MYRVLMPIDGEEKRALAQSQAVMALPAASESVEVTLLHVSDDGAPDTVRELDAGERAVEHLTGEPAVGALETEIRRGDVVEETLAAAATHDADVIVLGGRKRSPMGSLVFGSVSGDVLLNARRPVMVTGEHLESERADAPHLGHGQDAPRDTPRHRHRTDEPGPYRVPSGTERAPGEQYNPSEAREQQDPPEFGGDGRE